MMSKVFLSCLYDLETSAGQLELALSLYHNTLGPDHPDTLRAMRALPFLYENLGRHAQALTVESEVLTLCRAKLGPDHPDTLSAMDDVATSYAALGRHADALKLREEALARRKAKLGPDHPNTLRSMWALAESLIALNRGSEALPIINGCLERAAGKVANPMLVSDVIDLRLRHFEKVKDAAGCRQTAEMWERLSRTDAGSLYNVACYRAVTAAVAAQTPGPGAARLAAADADRAMDWLRKAVAAGYRDIPNLLKDADLAPLRGRADYAALLRDLADTPAAPAAAL